MSCNNRLPIVIGLLALCLTGPLNAELIVSKFIIEVTESSIILPWEEIPDGITNIRIPPYGMPGEIYNGNITYDDSNIPQTGNYTIGFSHQDPASIDVDEIQAIDVEWTSPFFGSSDISTNIYDYAIIFFEDKVLTEMNLLIHHDLYPSIEDEVFMGNTYYGYGYTIFNFDYLGETDYGFAELSVRGTVDFSVVEPEFILFIIISFTMILILKVTDKLMYGNLQKSLENVR
jgi:hypothetical protein